MRRLDRQDVAPRQAARAAAPAGAQAAAPSGASGERGMRLAIAPLAAALAIAAGWGAWAWLRTTPGFAVRRVVVSGATRTGEDRVAAASGALGRNALGLDLAEVRARLVAEPWIAEAVVRRALPHALRVSIVEREPEAVVREGGRIVLIDERGRALQELDAPSGSPLPEITGLQEAPPEHRDARRALAAATIAALREKAPALFARTRSVDASQDDKLVLTAQDCPPIWLSGPESADEAGAFALRLDGIGRAIGRAAWVDVRWRDRLYVMPERS